MRVTQKDGKEEKVRNPETKKPSRHHNRPTSNKGARENTPKGDDKKRLDPKIELARKTVHYQRVTLTNKKKEDIREEYVGIDFELSIGMPRHLMNHEESKTNYPREERGEREDTPKAMEYGIISRQESGVYTGADTDGDGIREVEARDQCLE